MVLIVYEQKPPLNTNADVSSKLVVYFLVLAFNYISTMCMLAVKAGICPDSPEPWLQADAISTEMSSVLIEIMIIIKNLDTVVI